MEGHRSLAIPGQIHESRWRQLLEGLGSYIMYPSESRNLPRLLTLTYQSLEQVPVTGRWRFMNTSPRFEAKVRSSQFCFLGQPLDALAHSRLAS